MDPVPGVQRAAVPGRQSSRGPRASGTRRTYQTFSGCRNCGQVYWHGAHSKRLEQIIDSAVRAVSTVASG